MIEADYTGAITALTHYSLPTPAADPRSLVRDAVFLDKHRDTAAGAFLIQQYSGRRPKQSEALPTRSPSATRQTKTPQDRLSPSASPARFVSQQRQLEGLFREVTGNLQKRTEGWDVSKAVRSAVGEVRRNMNNYQSSHSRQSSLDTPRLADRRSVEVKPGEGTHDLQRKVREIQERNMVLAKMLDDSLQTLRAIKLTNPESTGEAEENMNVSLAKIQFVSVYLSNPDIPIPKEEAPQTPKLASEITNPPEEQPSILITTDQTSATKGDATPRLQSQGTTKDVSSDYRGREPTKSLQRPSLVDSSFSFMLGENRHRSSFVSSVADLPEQRRGSESRSRPEKKPAETKAHQERKESKSEDDGFSLTKIGGG